MLRPFAGLGLGGQAWAAALLYGAVKTGFTEELLFRGLIAGSLARRFGIWRGNSAQALIFLLPHLGGLFMAPELWVQLLLVVCPISLIFGWVRIRSGSILGSWLMHGSANVAMALVVAARATVP